MKITSSESKDNLGRSGKRLITSLGFKAEARPKKYKKSRYSIVNVSKKEISKVIKKFENLPYMSYERRRPIHEPTNSYFYLSILLAKCMMRADAIKLHVYPIRTEMNITKNIPILHVCSIYESELNYCLVYKTLLQIYSTDKDKSKRIIINGFST